MFDLVANRKRLVQIVIAIIMLPFALFGVDFYFRGMDSADQLAKVGDQEIGSQEYTNALRQHQDQLRQMMQGKVDTAMLSSPEVKLAVLDKLVDEKILLKGAEKERITISDAQVSSIIREVPAFKDESGKFSKERYEMLLRTQSLTPAMFEANLRRDALVGQMRQAVEGTHWLPKTVTERLGKIRAQAREVSQSVIALQPYLGGVTLGANEAKEYYDKNTNLYALPERVRVEYLQVSMEALAKNVTVTDGDVQKYYQEHSGQFEKAEERRASHILITVDVGAAADVKAKAKAKAEELLSQSRKAPAQFGELAKTNSQDPGSASTGGDLGFFPKGRMAPAFDAAVFAMKPGEVSGPVETKFGFHIIKLEEIKGGERQALEQVRAQIEEEVRKTNASRLYAESAEQFSNLVYEQSDSLKPAADAIKLVTEQSGWITRDRAEPAVLGNEKLLSAIFADEAIKNKRNTEAVDVGNNTLVAARVIEHVPSTRQPFEVVREIIEDHLKSTKAAVLAKKDGESKLARLRTGEALDLTWSPGVMVSREKPEGLSPEAAQTVFQADVSKLPAYAGFTTSDQRYVIFRIGKVENAPSDAAQDKQLATQVSTLLAREIQSARLKILRDKAKVVIHKEKLDKN